MSLDLKKPCKNCPFLKASVQPINQGWLGGHRATEIIESLKDDKNFICHKTIPRDYEDESDTDSRTYDFSNSQVCAGSVIMMAKQGFAVQSVRIASRLNLYDPDKLLDQEKVVDNMEEFIEQHTNHQELENNE